jgi:hypothetical protein
MAQLFVLSEDSSLSQGSTRVYGAGQIYEDGIFHRIFIADIVGGSDYLDSPITPDTCLHSYSKVVSVGNWNGMNHDSFMYLHATVDIPYKVRVWGSITFRDSVLEFDEIFDNVLAGHRVDLGLMEYFRASDPRDDSDEVFVHLNSSVIDFGCDNIPDGQATITANLRASDGTPIEIVKPFDFTTVGAFDVAFEYLQSGLINYYGATLESYVFEAPKGFTEGTIQLQEYWAYAPAGWPEYLDNERNISFRDGQTVKVINLNAWLATITSSLSAGYVGIPTPVVNIGTVSLNCDFFPLPECHDDVIDDIPEITDEYVAEAYPQPIEIPVSPVEPIAPIPPPEPFTPIPPTLPTEPQEGLCDCEVYLAKYLGAALSGLTSILETRLKEQNDIQRFLIETISFQNALLMTKLDGLQQALEKIDSRLFIEHEDGADKSITEVIEDMEDVILVDSFECWKKSLRSPYPVE